MNAGYTEHVYQEYNCKDYEPIHQREEIIRCMDCKCYTDDEMEYCHYCNKWCEQVEPDGFCAWGERKDENGR